VKKAQVITNQDERAKLYEQAQQVYHDDIPGMLFADAKAFVGVRDSVHGSKIHFLGGQPFGGVSVAP
jgi:dipeptide transport system substrate-binding protein